MRWLVASIESSCARRVLVVDVVAVHGDRVARLPFRTAEPTRSTTPAASLPTTWNGWSWRAPHTLSLPRRCEEPERGQRLEDRRPHRVEVDRRRHHRDERLVGRQLGQRRPRRRAATCAGPSPPTASPRTSPARRPARPRPGTTRERQGAELVGGSAVDDRGRGCARSRVMDRDDVASCPASGIRSSAVHSHRSSSGRSAMPGSVIVSSARTPDRQALRRAGVVRGHRPRRPRHRGRARAGRRSAGEQVDYVILGQVLQAGAGQMPARQAAVKAGIPMTVPAMTINKVCLSGIDAIYLADQMIQAGDAEVVVAGGMESMTQGALPAAERARGLPHGQRRAGRLDDRRRPVVRVRRGAHGRRHRALHRRVGRHHARDAGRVRGQEPRARRGRDQGRPLRRGDRADRDPAAQGRPGPRRHRRRRAPRHHRRVARQAAARVRARTAPSPPATRRRSPTAPPPSSSRAASQGRGARRSRRSPSS